MTHVSPSRLAALAILLVLLAGCGMPAATFDVSSMQPNIANGGRAVAIAVHPADANTSVVASESGGLFRSTDHGATWRQVTGNATFWFTDVAYLPSHPDVILATADRDTRVVSGGGIWRSADGGATWSHVAVTPPTAPCAADFAAYALAIEPGRERAWAGTLCGLAYSDDQGASWHFLPAAPGYAQEKTYAVLAPSSTRLVIVTDAGVKSSRNGGATWPPAGSTGHPNIQRGQHNQIAVSPADPDQVFWAFNYIVHDHQGHPIWHVTLERSPDDGASWTTMIDVETFLRAPFVRTTQPLPGSSDYTLYFSGGGDLFQRADVTGGVNPAFSTWSTLRLAHSDPADVAFGTDHRTPLLVASDGGLQRTTDGGANWALTGGGAGGYDALQVTEVTGQIHPDGRGADLYFGTQDNFVWGSPDKGATWPASTGGEGFFLNVMRRSLPAAETKVNGVTCGECGNFIAGPVLAGATGFPNAPNVTGNPRLLTPGSYIESTNESSSTDAIYSLTTNTGASWAERYRFPEEPRDFPRVGGPEPQPVVYTAIKVPGATANGSEVIQIKRVADVLGTATPLVSNVGGSGPDDLGSLGVFPTMFAWYKPFAVDPSGNRLIASDVTDHKVKLSVNGGASWTAEDALTALVTGSGAFRFDWTSGGNTFTQTSTFAFDPDCYGHIVVGTRQAGIFQSFDQGASWEALRGSDLLPDVSSVFFAKGGEMIFSSYGRGLWSSTHACPASSLRSRILELGVPTIYLRGGRIPITQIHDPEACPVCGFVLVQGGRILDYRADAETGALTDVTISGGKLREYAADGKEIALSLAVSTGSQVGGLGGDAQLRELLGGKTSIQGLFVEGKTLRGPILSPREMSVDDLPHAQPLGAHIRVSLADQPGPIVVTGTGFRADRPVVLLVDGSAAQPEGKATTDKDGSFTVSIPSALGVGGHAILVRQETDGGVIQDASAFLVSVHEAEGGTEE